MSLPTRLSNLAISGMPPTSTSTARHNPTKEDPVSSSDECSGSEDGSGEDSDTSTSRILTSTNTNLQYDASRLTPTTFSRARAGLKSPFDIVGTSAFAPEYYAFQIAESFNFAVRVGAPGSKYATLTCSCDAGGEQSTKPCRHIFFLLDQIAGLTLDEDDKEEPLPLTRDGVPRETLDAFQIIKDAEAAGLNLLQKLQTGSNSGVGQNQTERINDIRDILASFSATDTKDEYRPEILSSKPALDNQIDLKDLEKTLAVSMLTNDALFHQLRTIASPNHCASDYFDKKRMKVKRALDAMNYYTSTKKLPPGFTATPDAAWCARVLEGSVNDIVTRVNEARTPLNELAKQSAAKALSQILRDLSDHNIDLYNRKEWAHTRTQAALGLKDRNLFVRFFGDLPPEGGKKFILDDLSDLGDAAMDYLFLIEHAAEKFSEAYRNNQVPKVYGEKLQKMMRDLKPSATRLSRTKSGSKRPGDESGGDNKRMK